MKSTKDMKEKPPKAGLHALHVLHGNALNLIISIKKIYLRGNQEVDGSERGFLPSPFFILPSCTYGVTLKIKFWGTRGSIPAPGPDTIRYGGNTPCIEVRNNDGGILVIEAGSGLRELGRSLKNEKNIIPLLISHTHWDHIQGFPFFEPAYIPGNEITIYGSQYSSKNIRELFHGQMDHDYFPIALDSMGAIIQFKEITEGEYDINGFKVKSRYLNHGNLGSVIGFRIEADGKSFTYANDTEPYSELLETAFFRFNFIPEEEKNHKKAFAERIKELSTGADLLLHDAQYTQEEYETRIGWGHSPIDYAVEVAVKHGAMRLGLFHYDPARTDNEIDDMLTYCKGLVRGMDAVNIPEIIAVHEKMEITL